MRESQIERYLVKRVKEMKGLCLKINSTSMGGLPDRMVLLPGGKIIFLELKASGCKARPRQLAVMRKLSVLGFPTFVADSTLLVDNILKKADSDEI